MADLQNFGWHHFLHSSCALKAACSSGFDASQSRRYLPYANLEKIADELQRTETFDDASVRGAHPSLIRNML